MTKDILIELKTGTLKLDFSHFQWEIIKGEGKKLEIAREYANILSSRYDASPSAGQPGYGLATTIAKKLGGEAILPPLPEAEEGVVY